MPEPDEIPSTWVYDVPLDAEHPERGALQSRPVFDSDRPDPDEEFEVGQVWRHHSTGDYRIVGFNPDDGRPRICRSDSMRPVEVWPDYLQHNFTLVGAREEANPDA